MLSAKANITNITIHNNTIRIKEYYLNRFHYFIHLYNETVKILSKNVNIGLNFNITDSLKVGIKIKDKVIKVNYIQAL